MKENSSLKSEGNPMDNSCSLSSTSKKETDKPSDDFYGEIDIPQSNFDDEMFWSIKSKMKKYKKNQSKNRI